MAHDKKVKTISDARGLNAHDNDIRVVMPTPIAAATAEAVGRKPTPLVYSQKKEDQDAQFNWQQLEEISFTMAGVIAQTATEFQKTIDLVSQAGTLKDPARFDADVRVTMEDLTKFTDEFCKIKAKHEGCHGFIETAEERMKYLTVFEDYRAFGAFFQGTMHHKLMDFTEYALDAKDALVERAGTEENTTKEG